MCESLAGYIRRVERYSFLDENRIRELVEEVEVKGVKVLDQYIEENLKLLEDPCLDELEVWHAEEVKERIRRRILNVKRWKTGEPKVDLECGSREAYDVDRIPVVIAVNNPRVLPLECDVYVRGDFKLVGQKQPIELKVEPLSLASVDLMLEPSTEGEKTLTVEVRVKGESPVTIKRDLTITVKKYELGLEADARALQEEVVEGGEVTVLLRLQNTGTVPLEVELRNPFDKGEEKIFLKPGDVREVTFNGAAPSSGYIEIPPLRYSDPMGRAWEKKLKKVNIKIKKIDKKTVEREEIEFEKEKIRETTEGIDLEGIFSEAAKHVLASLVGKVIGERFPEEKKFPKQVLIEDLPYHVQGDVTIVFEDPAAVVEEDLGEYVRVRRAKPAELENIITVEAAKALVSSFKLLTDSVLSSWRPSPEAQVSKKEVSLTRDLLKDVMKKESRRVNVEELVEKLPENFYVEYTYREAKMLGKRLLKVYVGACSRLKAFIERGRDDRPLSMGDVFNTLELPTPDKECPVVYILASPTGWDSSAREMAESASGNTLYVLLNLKTGEVNYNAREEHLHSLVEALGYIREPVVFNEELSHLDKLLLDGKIPEEVYKKQVATLLRRKEGS